MESCWNIVIREKPDFSHYTNDDLPLPLSVLSVRACVYYSELLLDQLHNSVLPFKVQKLLVETLQRIDCVESERRQRFYAALKDANGSSMWTFPGCPLVFRSSSEDVDHLDYINCPFLKEELAEYSQRVKRLSINCYGETIEIPSRFQLTALTLYDAYWPSISPSAILVRLELLSCIVRDLTFLPCFPNVEWLSLLKVKCKGESKFNVSQLCLLQKLRHLNLTGSSLGQGNCDLSPLFCELPLLEHLDLTEFRMAHRTIHTLYVVRSRNPLKFLGLFKTVYDFREFAPPMPAETIASMLTRERKEAILQFGPPLNVSQYIHVEMDDSWEIQLDYLLQVMRMWTDTFQFTYKTVVLANLHCLLFEVKNDPEEMPDNVKRMLVDLLFDYTFAGRDVHVLTLTVKDISFVFSLLHSLTTYIFQATQVGRYACLRLHVAWYVTQDVLSDHRDYRREEMTMYRRSFACYKESSTTVLKMLSSHLLSILRLASRPLVENRDAKVKETVEIVGDICSVFGDADRTALNECNDLMRRIEATLPVVPLKQRVKNRLKRIFLLK